MAYKKITSKEAWIELAMGTVWTYQGIVHLLVENHQMSEEKAEKVFRNYTPPDDREAIISENTNYSNYIKSVRG